MSSRIAFLRPRLGIGGAERLIVDAAHELIAKGHDVAFHVAARAGDLEFDDIPAAMPFHRNGARLPEHIGGRLRLPCAMARMLMAARGLASVQPPYDVVFCDVVPHVLPWLKRRTPARLLYFGHFPNLRLRRALRKGWYGRSRIPLDRWESRGLAAADGVIVNSHFTAHAFRQAFPELASVPLEVLHPGVIIPISRPKERHYPSLSDDSIVLLSIARVDPRKNLLLGIRALDALRSRVGADVFARLRLVFAGRFDERLPEVRDVRTGLAREARARGLERQVLFVDSPSAPVQAAWLERALVVVDTADAEHFGIVPLEAMAASRAVVAVARGGPLETVVVGRTGLLCEPSPDAFAAAIARFIHEPDLARRMGAEGRAHVEDRFSRDRFGDQLDAIVRQLTSKTRPAGVPGKAAERSAD